MYICGHSNTSARRVEGVERQLYACASPMVHGKLEGKLRVKMLVDSGSEMCVMSKDLWHQLRGVLPMDMDIRCSIGSANATHNRVFGVCHAVGIDIGGVEITIPVFVLEGAAQDMILGRPWERKARAQYDTRENGSLYITISTLDNQRRAVFCAVGVHNDRNRDRVRILQRHNTLTTSAEEGGDDDSGDDVEEIIRSPGN
jgi:hypothetical protein